MHDSDDSQSDDGDGVPPRLDHWTFGLTSDGDIRWDYERHHPALVSGLTQVKQDLLVALDTYEGEDPMDEEFGLDVFRAVRSTPHLRDEVRKTIEYDDYRHTRVKAVTDLRVEHDPPGSRNATVYITAELEDGEPLEFIFNLFGGTVQVA